MFAGDGQGFLVYAANLDSNWYWGYSMPRPVMLKKLKLNGSMKTYKTFYN